MDRYSKRVVKCFVPGCRNTSENSRDKLFLSIRESMKWRWCSDAKTMYTPGKRMLCCEDHVDLNEDLENYQEWKIMGTRPVLKLTAKLRNHGAGTSSSQTNQDLPISKDCPTLKAMLLNPAGPVQEKTLPSTSIHVDVATQYQIERLDQSTSTDDLKPRKLIASILSSPTSSATSMEPTFEGQHSSPSLYGSTTDTETTETTANDQPGYSARQQILNFISRNPKAYVGLPKQFLPLIKHIADKSATKILELAIIVTLYKINLNVPVHTICDQFQISNVTFAHYFQTGIKTLADYLQNLIYIPTLLQLKLNQPLSFKIRYSDVIILLDAFEIEIQKPHKPVPQAGSWSQYKHCNTVKYLIGSTPNGHVSYISKGYGGRISDKALVELSDFIQKLPDNAVIMADRGFKEIETLLMGKAKLLRPPSVYAASKPTKEQVIQAKVIASLRIHIERVIRRVREFRFLMPHATVSHKHVGYLDKIVLIACALVNLQSEIIKSQ